MRSCFIRWAQYLALFILVSGLWVFIPCAAIGGRYLQGWERWVAACSLQRLLRPYWNRRIGSAVGLGDPTGLGPQHCWATFFALVLYGRLERCKRGQELAICFQWHCKGLQRVCGVIQSEQTHKLQTKQEQEMPPMEAHSAFMARQDTSILRCTAREPNMLLQRTASLTNTVG